MGDFFTRKEVKARKLHKCSLCRDLIRKKETYVKHAGSYSGDFFSCKLHAHCDALLEAYLDIEGYGEYSFDEVSDWLYDKCKGCRFYKDGDCTIDDNPYDCEVNRAWLDKG